ncbi:MAG: alanine racemase [Coriobacteriia bacterium]|nr:alanine racemase [Coriobacteriia bacterium]
MTYRRPAWAEVDLGAVGANVGALKAKLPARTLFMAVVKADGYGHGAAEVARAALAAGADRLGVATVEEGFALRQAGVVAPIQLMAEPPASAAPLLVEHDLIPAAFTPGFVQALDGAAREAGRVARYHLKVDTGMNRIGARAEDAARLAASLRLLEAARLEGTFTHFATAEMPGDWELERQLRRFRDALAEMRTEGVDPGIVHSANTAAVVLHPESHMDMVRCGIGIYGLHPGEATRERVGLQPAMAVKSCVSCVKRIGLGEGVSYGMTYRAAAPVTIATLPLGYADGIHRVLSDRMEVLVGGRRCRQVGRICMDQLMVEVPEGLRVRPGDEAVLVGRQGEEAIGMDEVAKEAGTINYEMACVLALRMPRRFI